MGAAVRVFFLTLLVGIGLINVLHVRQRYTPTVTGGGGGGDGNMGMQERGVQMVGGWVGWAWMDDGLKWG